MSDQSSNTPIPAGGTAPAPAPSQTGTPAPIIPSGGQDFQRGLPPSEPISRPPVSTPIGGSGQNAASTVVIPSGGQLRSDGAGWVIPSESE